MTAGLPLSPSGCAVRVKPRQSGLMTCVSDAEKHERDDTPICVCCFHQKPPSNSVCPRPPPPLPHHHLFLPLSPTLLNDDRNGPAPREQGSHFNVSSPYSLALGSGFSPPLPSDLQRPRWLTGGGKRDKAGSGVKKRGGFIVLLRSPPSLCFYGTSSLTGDVA